LDATQPDQRRADRRVIGPGLLRQREGALEGGARGGEVVHLDVEEADVVVGGAQPGAVGAELRLLDRERSLVVVERLLVAPELLEDVAEVVERAGDVHVIRLVGALPDLVRGAEALLRLGDALLRSEERRVGKAGRARWWHSRRRVV